MLRKIAKLASAGQDKGNVYRERDSRLTIGF